MYSQNVHPRPYDKFDDVILTHTCRDHAELAYGDALFDQSANDPLIGCELCGSLQGASQ